ncbi:methyl-accepting chemotaxis protein [Marinospirillum sp.]|uniref:methyl-accepting chemotaxis protein n=1 Tax=Marinospirillum sp. TaxID=2183934 RepID=UPI003A857458
MPQLTIKLRIVLLALLPMLLLAGLLVSFNSYQAHQYGQQNVHAFRTAMETQHQAEIRNYLELARSAIAHLHQNSSTLSEAERQRQALDILRQMRFDDSGSIGYYFVYDRQGRNLAHGINPALEGRDLIGFQDPNGLYVIRELVQAAERGGDFVYYHWMSTETDANEPKLGYAELLPGWNWVIGTGFWIDGLDRQVATLEADSATALQGNLISALITALITAAIIAVIALWSAKRLTDPLQRAVQAMQAISEGDGDLTLRLPAQGQNELGQLASAFNAFADQVQQLVHQAVGSSQALHASAADLQHFMQEAQDGVARQQNESDQVATAMNEMAAAAQEVAQSANQASGAAHQAEQQVIDSQTTLSAATQAISGLAAQVDEGIKVVTHLGHESENIGGVLDVIRGIAEQTNLLALNAAIEAARAGEAGRGFAVVADEVRSLASRTQESTQEIDQMIQRLQEGAQSAVKLISQLHQSSQASVEEIQRVEQALDQIRQATQTINAMNAQIASAAEEQTNVSETINENVHQIVAISDQTAQGTQAASDVTQRLNHIANEMHDLVSRYKA